ncbi:MAG: PH domain-containing protein [Saccharospirillaceae bacterium]|nr:PH domain-containing protein [Pseudomonadales bacterium]NRB81614.1 PH domain-containing protein [Saccharospirillaceae bacterium]
MDDWQRLSKFSIVFFVFKQFTGLINIVPVFLFAGFSLRESIDFNSPYFLLGLFGFVCLIILSAVISYLNFYYIQKEDRFLVRQGYIFKKKTELPFARIQNINLIRPFYYRFLDLTILKMDSAGSAENEISLAALTLEHSEKIKQDIQRYISKESNKQFVQENEGDLPSTLDLEGISEQVYKQQFSNITVLNTRSLSDIIINGITNNRTWIVLAAAAPFAKNIIDRIINFSSSLGFDIQSYVEHSSILILSMLVVAIFFFLTFLFSVLSVLGSIFSFYQFSLTYTKKNKSYSRSSGLLTKYEIHLKQSRVQLLRWSQNWLDILFNRLNMKFEPFSEKQNNQTSDFFGKIMVPSITKSEFKQIANHCFETLNFDEKLTKPVHIYSYIRSIYWVSLPFSILLFAFLFASQSSIVITVVVSCVLFIFLNIVNFQSYRRAGYLELDQYIVLRKGFIGVNYAIFPKYKIQQIRKIQSYWLKKRKLASVKFVLASGSIRTAILPEEIVDRMINNSLYQTQKDNRSWM